MTDPRAASKNIVWCLLPLLAACTPSSSEPMAASERTPAVAATATRFSHDDAGQPGVTLPNAIARALGTDERVLNCAEGTRDGVSQFKPDWVAVRRFDLNQDGRADWIVNGRHDCLRENGSAAWWAYADEAAGQRLLLASPTAEALRIEPSRTRGFHDLRLQRDGGDEIARYDGTEYALRNTGIAQPAAAPDTHVDTVAGRLDIVELPTADGAQQAFRIVLAGRELRRTGRGGDFPDFPVPRIQQRYPQGIAPFDEVIVFQQDMRGNACDGGPLWMLGLRRDGSHAISEPIDFCGGKAPQLSATREQLTIVLPGGPLNRGEGTIPTETWRYRGGDVRRVQSP